MEAHERPLLLLKEKNAPKLPADLRERVYLEYGSNSETLIEDLRESLSRQTDFIAQKGEPYLSMTLLSKSGELSEKVCRYLVREFTTCRGLLCANADVTARKLVLNPKVIQTAQDLVRESLARYGYSS